MPDHTDNDHRARTPPGGWGEDDGASDTDSAIAEEADYEGFLAWVDRLLAEHTHFLDGGFSSIEMCLYQVLACTSRICIWMVPEKERRCREYLSHTSFGSDLSLEKYWSVAHVPSKNLEFWDDHSSNLESYFEEAKAALAHVLGEANRV